MFLSWIWKTCIIDVPRTSHYLVPGRSRNWVPPTSPFRTFEYLFFQKKKQYICKTRTIAPKKILFKLNYQLLCWSPKSSLEVMAFRTFKRPSGDFPGKSHAGWATITITNRTTIKPTQIKANKPHQKYCKNGKLHGKK